MYYIAIDSILARVTTFIVYGILKPSIRREQYEALYRKSS